VAAVFHTQTVAPASSKAPSMTAEVLAEDAHAEVAPAKMLKLHRNSHTFLTAKTEIHPQKTIQHRQNIVASSN